MKFETLIMIIGFSFLVWWLWLEWQSRGEKRKNDEVGYDPYHTEKPKRLRKIMPEQETFEHTHIWPVDQSSSLFIGHSTRWVGGDVNLLELEFGQQSLDRINEAIEQTDETNDKLQEAIQHMKDMTAEYEIHPLSELMEDQALIDTEEIKPPRIRLFETDKDSRK